ncbi:hypothetical protein [Blastochloris sulfoviridis]|uniref:Uncharacterized protein n=1 Tax=Blastochloris sulfoviridis TaxID=50712 RepID=A0A5M6HSU1_9HYPH|nr:hypothetical protein [Blastochloris sulfoviridis]KAA5598992.1 hypothetical protein F1193_12880 [Blastochloris sulfoviridis]
MSGPKVVRIVTREEIEAICRREIAIAEAAAEALRQAHRRHGGLGAETERAIAESARRLADLFGAERHLDVQKQAPQMAAFFRSETERVEREAVAAAEAARSRRRRVADAARSVCAALEAAGRPVAEPLRGVTARALVAPEHELDDLQAVIDAGFRGLVAASRPGGGDIGTGTRAETRALAARLGAQETPDTLAAWLARQTPAPSPADARLDTALAAVEALGDAELAATYTARAATLDGVGGERRALLLDSLLLDASREAKRLRDARELRARLCEAAAGLDALGTQAALALAARIRQARPDALANEDMEHLLAEAATVAERETSAIAAAARRHAVLGALAALGYEVREGMATVWERDGRLLIRKPGTADYGVELGAPADASRMQVRLVGADRPSAPRTAGRDRDQEVSWCADFARLRDILSEDGGDIAIDRAVEAGAQPVKTVAFPNSANEGARDVETSPRLRTLR